MFRFAMAFAAVCALSPAQAQEPAPPLEELRGVTFHVSGLACAACGAALRTAVDKVPGARDIDVSVGEKFLRFRVDVRKTAIQTLMKTFLGEDERFPSRLVLQLENARVESGTIDRARMAVAAVAGVRSMSLPDKDGIVLVTFHLEQATLLPDLLDAAKSAGLSLRDASARKPDRPKDKE